MVKRLDKGFQKQIVREAVEAHRYTEPKNLEEVLSRARLDMAAAKDPVTLNDGFGKWFWYMTKNFGAAGLMVGSAVLAPIAYDHLENLEGSKAIKNVYKAADNLEDTIKNPEESAKSFTDSVKDFGGKIVDGFKNIFYDSSEDSDDAEDVEIETPTQEPAMASGETESRAVEDIGIPDSGVDDVYFAMGDYDYEIEENVFYAEEDVIGENNFEAKLVNGSLEDYLPLFGNESRTYIELTKGTFDEIDIYGPISYADRIILYSDDEGLYVIGIEDVISIPGDTESVAIEFLERNEFDTLHEWIGELDNWDNGNQNDIEFRVDMQNDDLSLHFYPEADNRERFELTAGSHRLFKIGQNEYNISLETVNMDDVNIKVQINNGSVQNYTMDELDTIDLGNVSLGLYNQYSNWAEFDLELHTWFSMNYDLDDITREVSDLENVTHGNLRWDEVTSGVVVPETLYLFDINGDDVNVTIPKADTEFGWMNVRGSVSGSEVNFAIDVYQETELAKLKFVLSNDTEDITIFDVENISAKEWEGIHLEKSFSLNELHGKYAVSVYAEDQSGNNINYLATALVGYGELSYDALDFDVSGATGVLHGTLVTKDPQTVVLKDANGNELQNKTFVPNEIFDVYADFDLTNYTQGAYFLEFQNTVKSVTLEGLVYGSERLDTEDWSVKVIDGYKIELLNYTDTEAELKITNLDTGENETRTLECNYVSAHTMYNTIEEVLGLNVFVRDIDSNWGVDVIYGKKGEVNNGEKVVFDNKEFSVVDMIGGDIIFKDGYGNYEFIALDKGDDTFFYDDLRFYVDSWAVQEDVIPIIEFNLNGDVGDPYWDGYQEGKSDGYVDGYSDGKSDGYDEGYSAGYDDGLTGSETNEYGEGYRDGYQDSQEDSANDYISGYNAGLENGTVDGYQDGRSDGFWEGYWDGYSNGENATKSAVDELEEDKDEDESKISRLTSENRVLSGLLAVETVGILAYGAGKGFQKVSGKKKEEELKHIVYDDEDLKERETGETTYKPYSSDDGFGDAPKERLVVPGASELLEEVNGKNGSPVIELPTEPTMEPLPTWPESTVPDSEFPELDAYEEANAVPYAIWKDGGFPYGERSNTFGSLRDTYGNPKAVIEAYQRDPSSVLNRVPKRMEGKVSEWCTSQLEELGYN